MPLATTIRYGDDDMSLYTQNAIIYFGDGSILDALIQIA